MSSDLRQQLHALAERHPGTHPYTLSLLYQAETGVVLSGLQVKQLLGATEPTRQSPQDAGQ